MDGRDFMVPVLMATQHPDSTRRIGVYEEVVEAIEAYRVYSCDEVMIDYEGKLTPYHQVEWIVEKAFEEGVPIGEEFILTPRIPNDDLEDISRHIMAITEAVLANIRAQRLGLPQVVRYVIMPMTENVRDSIRMQRRLHKIERVMAEECGLNISQPLLVIPLIETVDRQIHSDLILEAFHRALLKEVSFFTNELRIFLGKSDSALLYGHIASSIALKIALSKLHRWGEERFINVKPILGMGKPPFRGHLAPHNIHVWIKNWLGYFTVTIQSAMRYNTSKKDYDETITIIREHRDKKAENLGEDIEAKLIRILPRLVYPYRRIVAETVEKLYPIFDHIPSTRERIQYTKYYRVLDGVKIPRAIKFVAGYYTIGLPPTLLDAPGLSTLSDKEIEVLTETYEGITHDLEYDLSYYNREIAEKFLPRETINEIDKSIRIIIDKLSLNPKQDPDPEYWELAEKLTLNNTTGEELAKIIIRMAEYRGFLG